MTNLKIEVIVNELPRTSTNASALSNICPGCGKAMTTIISSAHKEGYLAHLCNYCADKQIDKSCAIERLITHNDAYAAHMPEES